MNRTQFLRHFLTATIITLGPRQLLAFAPGEKSLIQPPMLQPGNTIGITCPAGAVVEQDVLTATQMLESWGFRVFRGNTVGKSWMVFGGTDEERLADLQQMINNPNIHAILCGRGGYGVTRILDSLDLTPLTQHPKWIIGYSDITALHCQLQQQYNIASIHADMVNGLGNTLDSSSFTLYELLTGTKPVYSFPSSGYNRKGIAEGQLVGGNLSMVLAMMGSSGELQTDGKLLFLEDVREYKYSIDRMLQTLKRAGKLKNLQGLVLGGFVRLREDNPDEYAMNIGEIILEKVAEYTYPVCFNFPAGHQVLNMALKFGASHRLHVEDQISSLVALE